MIGPINIALTGLNAASKQLAASASNIANLQTAGSLEEGARAPYTPLRTQQTALTDSQGTAKASKVPYVPKTDPFVPAYDPNSPFANAEGLIGLPNTDLAEEAVNLNLAKIQYKANIKTIEAASELSEELFRIIDDKA